MYNSLSLKIHHNQSAHRLNYPILLQNRTQLKLLAPIVHWSCGKQQLISVPTGNEKKTDGKKSKNLLIAIFLRTHTIPAQQEFQANSQRSPWPSLVFWTNRNNGKESASLAMEAWRLNPFLRSPNLNVSAKLPRNSLPSELVDTKLSFADVPALGTEIRISSESIRIVRVSVGSALRWIKNRVRVSFRVVATRRSLGVINQWRVESRVERM